MSETSKHPVLLEKILGVPVHVKIMGIALGAIALFGTGLVYAVLPLGELGGLLPGFVSRLTTTTITFAAISLAGAFALTFFLSRPLRQLVEVAQAVGSGNLQARATIWAEDEIGHLGRAVNEMTESLAQKERMRMHLLGKVIQAQERERARISREMHDQVGQSLTALILGLKDVELECNQCQCSKIPIQQLRKHASQAIDEIHQLTVALRPSVLDDLGLFVAVQRQIEVLKKHSDLEVDVQTSGFSDGERLIPELELTLYRVIQEALTNAIRHGHARSVTIIIQRRPKDVRLIVEDDGRGFEASSWKENALSKDHLGLLGMEERVALFDGKIMIESSGEERGAKLFIEIPMVHSLFSNKATPHERN